MSSHFQFARGRRWGLFGSGVCVAALCGLLFLCPTSRGDQNAPQEVIAHIQGDDVSIDGQMLERTSTLVSVLNGSVVTVHSGEAMMRLPDGGEISICGPAKLTVVESDGTMTLALQFGRMHFELPASVRVRVLTPMIVATPIDIEGGKRDLIVGLDQDNSMCVIAATGAVQLEQQFSGERLTVPESADFSLQGGQLVPVADAGQSCKCASVPMATPVAPAGSSPETTMVVPLPGTNESHPLARPDQEPVAEAPQEPSANYRIDLPALVFSPNSPGPPDVPTEATEYLIRQVHADPDWNFTGHVETPDFAQAMSQALGESGSGQTPASAEAGPHKKSGGFWASLKRFFVG